MDLVNSFRKKKNFFRFSKRCSEAREQYFWDFLGSHRGKLVGEDFVRFSTTNVFVPVNQLSTRDLFRFLENLKIKQDFFCLEFYISFDHSNNERYDSPIPDFGTKMVKKMLILECLGCFYKVNCGVDLGFLTHLFELLTCKRNHNF